MPSDTSPNTEAPNTEAPNTEALSQGTYARPPMPRHDPSPQRLPRQRLPRRTVSYAQGGERQDDGNAKAIALVAAGALAATAIGVATAKRRDAERRPEDDAPDRTALHSRAGDYELTGRTVTIGKPRPEIYAFFRDFQNLPDFMENVSEITPTGPDGRNVWTIMAPAGRTVEVETELSEDSKDEVIAWRSVEGSDIDTNGYVKFSDAPGSRGTVVELVIAYDPPFGALGRTVAKLFGREPHLQARRDLKRMKMLLETGEVATSARRREDVTQKLPASTR